MAYVKKIKLGNTTYDIPTGATYTAGSGIDITNNVISQMGDVYTDDIVSESQVGGSGVELASFSTQDNYWHIANSKVDDTIYIDGELELGSMGDLGANLQSEIQSIALISVDTTTQASSVELHQNVCYRVGTIASNFTIDIDDTDKVKLNFASELVFTYSSGTLSYSEVSPNAWTGDDCTNGVFVPVANKTYDIIFFNISRTTTPNIQAIVRGI